MPSPILSNQLHSNSGRVRHAYFTREGGTSHGIYAALNVGIGSNDNRQSVIENRAIIAKYMGVESSALLTAHQIHSPDVLHVTSEHLKQDWSSDNRPQVDAMITDESGIAIGVLTADCGPVLFCDEDAGVIGAAHAGWKGAVTGVLENTIDAMESAGANRTRINAVLGPTISKENYEVGPEFFERVVSLDADNSRYFADSKNEGRSMFDLPQYIVDRLTDAGVNATWIEKCTYEEEDRFFSYRRTTHRGEPDYGRQIAAINLLR